MSILAKKYVVALMKSMDGSELEKSYNNLNSLVSAFSNAKFNNILQSSDVSTKDKENLILSMFDDKDTKFTNFIKLLSENGRLNEIPSIVKELSKQIALKNNRYEGVLISNFEVPENEIKDIESNLSKKLNVDIKLVNNVTDYPGIKVEIDSLGLEVSFSQERLKNQIAEHILSSI